MRTADFDFALPPELIAQQPAAERDASRLLVLRRTDGGIEHRQFTEFGGFLAAGDVLVVNDSRVIPARLRGFKEDTRGAVEILLLEENAPLDWWVLLRPGKRVRPGSQLRFVDLAGAPSPLAAEVTDRNNEGHVRLRFRGVEDLPAAAARLGEIPLPPYIHRPPGAERDQPADRERYQTVYAARDGSVAAPTAGLHFTPALLADLRARGVEIHPVTLHVGLGTFAPVKADELADHVMHEERYALPAATATAINWARAAGRRVVAVGTTSCRVLESAARAADVDRHRGALAPVTAGRTRLFLHPPAEFRVVDALLTNFHLPQSTLIMLVSAFADPAGLRGRDWVLAAYAAAVQERYRFFSYGDAMFIQ